MNSTQIQRVLRTATLAAQDAGALMRKNFRSPKKINEELHRDIKLELDVLCQKRIEKRLHSAFPSFAFLGEEGTTGDLESEYRWVVDPIDGTVNFTYEIPHSCVSIALQRRHSGRRAAAAGTLDGFTTLVGTVYDPFVDELWTGVRGGPARLNGRPIAVSRRSKLEESIVSIGFSKDQDSLDRMLPTLNALLPKVRKVRIMGAAALAMVYVASGRLDAYVELGLRLWDIAAGGLILECAGGDFWHRPVAGREFTHEILANNGRIRKKIETVRAKARLHSFPK